MIPTKGILAVAALLVAILFVVAGIIGRWKLPLIGLAMLVVVAVVAGGLYPWAIQRFQVTPTEQALENEYIQRNIDMTRQAYGLDQTEVTPYDATTQTEKGALRQDTGPRPTSVCWTPTWSRPRSPSCSSSARTTSSRRCSRWTGTRSTARCRTP